MSGRPTEVPEHDVYICESKYHEVEKNVRKLAKGLKVGVLRQALYGGLVVEWLPGLQEVWGSNMDHVITVML